MANPKNPTPPAQAAPRSTERQGLGQSGYTAGRRDDDVALEHTLDTHNLTAPDEPADGLGTDDRFTGRGGTAPREARDRDDEGTAGDPGPRAVTRSAPG